MAKTLKNTKMQTYTVIYEQDYRTHFVVIKCRNIDELRAKLYSAHWNLSKSGRGATGHGYVDVSKGDWHKDPMSTKHLAHYEPETKAWITYKKGSSKPNYKYVSKNGKLVDY